MSSGGRQNANTCSSTAEQYNRTLVVLGNSHMLMCMTDLHVKLMGMSLVSPLAKLFLSVSVCNWWLARYIKRDNSESEIWKLVRKHSYFPPSENQILWSYCTSFLTVHRLLSQMSTFSAQKKNSPSFTAWRLSIFHVHCFSKGFKKPKVAGFSFKQLKSM